MLVLTRKAGEKIVIAEKVTLTLLSCNGKQPHIGIDVSREVKVVRAELLEERQAFCAVEHSIGSRAVSVSCRQAWASSA